MSKSNENKNRGERVHEKLMKMVKIPHAHDCETRNQSGPNKLSARNHGYLLSEQSEQIDTTSAETLMSL